MVCNAPIGVFDSGVGGLTVVREIIKILPEEQIIYFGDTARVPYGSKSKETVTAYSKQIVNFLLSKNVKAIVIACNTASALALESVSKETDIPIIGVIEPGARTAACTTKNGSIGIIATEATIRSNVYIEFLKQINTKLNVYGKACPLFVPLVEEGWVCDPITKEIAHRYINDFIGKNIDTLVLGCTHYPLLYDIIQEAVGESVALVNPAFETATALYSILEEKKLLCNKQDNKHEFFVSDGAEKFRNFANTILRCEIKVTQEVV